MIFETEHIEKLNGKIFAMLTPMELEIVRYFRDTGRKKGVAVSIGNRPTWNNLEESQIRQTNDRIIIKVNQI